MQVQNNEYIKIYEPSDLTLRPTVAGPNFPTCRLSNLVDMLLKPFLIHIKSYIKDNLNFLAKCSRKNKWDTILTNIQIFSMNMASKLLINGLINFQIFRNWF